MLMIVKHTFTRHKGGAKRSLGYFIHRPGDPEKEPLHRTPFTVENGEMRELTRSEANEFLTRDQESRPLVHRFVLSPSEYEQARDLRQMVDAMMAQLEHKKGIHLNWVGVEHYNTDNPHVHMLVSGYGENLVTGEVEQVRFDKSDYADLREWGHDWCIDLREFRADRLPEEPEEKNRALTREEAQAYRGIER